MPELEPEVLFRTEPLEHGGLVGVVTLSVEKTLNSLTLNMVDLLLAQLVDWESDPDIVFVWFEGAGRAFCAGGDIQALYHDMVANPGGPCPYCEDFFSREYRLDYLIHTYQKPTFVFAHGIVMGGGLGMASACDFRLGTEKTRIAMPEITIGLIPDAGATYSFMQMPETIAHFLALTGGQINGEDALAVGFVNHLVPSERKEELFSRLTNKVKASSAKEDISLAIERCVDRTDFPASNLEQHEALIEDVMAKSLASENPIMTLLDLAEQLAQDPWLEKAAATLKSGAPATAQIILEQFARAKTMTLKQMLMQELTLASQCSRHPDFAEGVRALLIDKDGSPAWQQPRMGEVPQDWIDAHFVDPWAKHPLADLDETRQ